MAYDCVCVRARLRSVFIRLREIVSIGISRLACLHRRRLSHARIDCLACYYICISFKCADFPSSPTIVIDCTRLSTSFFLPISRCVSLSLFLPLFPTPCVSMCVIYVCAWFSQFLFLAPQSHSFTAQTISWVLSVSCLLRFARYIFRCVDSKLVLILWLFAVVVHNDRCLKFVFHVLG